MPAEKWLVVLLRFNAVILMTAFPAALLPTSWMERIHGTLGMGGFPHGALIEYLTRSVSLLYGLFGIATWILSSDLPRFWPLVTFWSCSCVLAGPILLWIDYAVGMPLFWILFEGPYLFTLGIVMIFLQRAVGGSGNQSAP